jgi:zinc D-Ala-D-Ala carboxypeptidase
MTMLSKHFSLRELTSSSLAARHGIDNTPTQEVILELAALCEFVLEPVREHFDSPIHVNSGYRSDSVNKLAGGAARSQHVKGQAADFEVSGHDNLEVAHWLEQSDLEFDQLILECYVPGDPHSGWIHAAHRRDKPNRRRILTATRSRLGMIYSHGLPENK